MSSRLQLSVNYTLADDDPREWARRREDQGWDVLAVTDHLLTDYRPPFPHLWVAAGAIAAVTSRAQIETTFVNGVLRHPVDTAQAARQLQQVSDGRFELGVGAGWYQAEVQALGLRWPHAAERAGRLVEAVQILGPLLAGTACCFRGEHYDVDVPAVGPTAVDAPALVASVGGPRTIRQVTPHVDRIELKVTSSATRGGGLDWDLLGRIGEADVRALVGKVRAVRPDVPVDLFVMCNAADDVATRERSVQLGNGFLAPFFGPPEQVTEAILAVERLGVGRVQLTAMDPDSFDQLAALLIS